MQHAYTLTRDHCSEQTANTTNFMLT